MSNRSGLGILAVVVVGILGIGAGVRWHEAIAKGLGIAAVKAPTSADTPKKQLWTCSMHPQVIREEPGLCPICHMQLTPLLQSGAASAPNDQAMRIDPAVVQNMGVRTEAVAKGVLQSAVHATGALLERDPDASEISLRVSGWIEHLYANTDGMEIKKGEPLFDLYSPELSVVIEELIAARRETDRAVDEGARETATALRANAAAKLVRLGLSPEQTESLARLDAAPRIVTFVSPRSGHIRDSMNVRSGAAVMAGQRVLRILDPSVLWLEVRIYERDLGRIRIGQRAEAAIDAFPGQKFTGLVSFIHPHLDEVARAGVVRINIANEESRLREGMFASVRIETDPGPETILIPREAVIDTGERQLVMVSLGEGRFEPRPVSVGLADDEGRVQVLQGLAAGESVVVSGQFLLDSESRLREAVRKYASGPPGATTGPIQTTKPVDQAPGVVPVGPAPREPSPPSPTPPAQSPPAAPPGVAARIDAVYASYLQMSASLGKVQEKDVPLDPAGLVMAAKSLRAAATSEQDRSLAAEVLGAAEAMTGQNLTEQRQRFKALGAAMLKLADARPPSMRIAPKLYHMHCPMAPGDWLQTDDTIANPFFADQMKECAEIVREIPSRSEAPR